MHENKKNSRSTKTITGNQTYINFPFSRYKAQQKIKTVEIAVIRCSREYPVLFQSENFRKDFSCYVNAVKPDLFSMRLYCKTYSQRCF